MKSEMKPEGRPVKKNGYSSATLHAKRNQRRIDAEKRDCAYQSLTVKDRLDRVNRRRGQSKRETSRLLAANGR